MSRRGNVPVIAPNHLRDHADQARIDRIWARIDADLPSRETTRSRGTATWGLLAAAAFAAFGGGLALGRVLWSEPAVVALPTAVPVADTAATEVLAAGTEERTFPLPGGGSVRLGPGATVEVERSAGASLTIRLVQGEASVDTLGDRRELAIVAGEARLATRAGSVLDVRRSEQSVDVSVKNGAVDITSPAGTRQLRSGERDAVPIHSMAVASRNDVVKQHHVAPGVGSAVEPAVEPTAVASAAAPDTWRARHGAGDYEQALQLLKQQPGGIQGAIDSAKSATELMAISDVARRGDAASAMRALTRVVDEFPGDPSAQIASYHLAKLYEASGRPDEAKKYRDRVLNSAGPLAEDALCQSMHASVNKEEAIRLAKEYLGKYPDGRCKDDADRIMQGDDGPDERDAVPPGADGGALVPR